MSDKSPFTLVRPVASNAAEIPAVDTTNRPKVVLPTKRKNIPQATEPVVLAPGNREDPLKDVIERVKKAAVAPPVEMAPRPAPNARKEVRQPSPPTLATPIPEAAGTRPGATLLPPVRKNKISENTEIPDYDPFETNTSALAQNEATPGFGQILLTPESDEAAPLTPAKIRRSKAIIAKTETAPELPLAPRQISVAKEFLPEVTRPTEVAAAPAAPLSIFKKASKVALPAPKQNLQSSVQADIQGWLEADGMGFKNHTPRSDAPIEEMALKSSEPPLVSSRRIKFCCPACNHTVSLPKRIVGQKTRCPQCASAIRAPHPKYGRGTYNYENNIEALLHPDHFEIPSAGRPRFMGIPIPEAHAAIIGSAAAMLVGASVMVANRWKQPSAPELASHHKAEAEAMSTNPTQPDLKKEDPFAIQEEAKQLVKNYLEADSVDQKIAFVREPERVTPLMKDYFSRGHKDQAVTVTALHCSTPGYYQSHDLKQRRSNVIAELSDGQKATFFVEYLPTGPKIEWESSVAYSPVDWQEIINTKPTKKTEPQLMRVAACVDKYYNDAQFKENSHLCVYLQDPITGEPLGNGYIPRMSEDGLRLRKFLGASNKNKPDQIMIEVRPVANSSKDRIVEITKFVKAGFRNPEPTTLASNQ